MKRYIAILVLFCFMITLSACEKGSIKEMDDPRINKNIILQDSFNVSADSSKLNTSAIGTVFIKEVKGNPEEIQIISSIEIDPSDWGGVTFYIADGWRVSNITSSYPENEPQLMPADYIATWTTSDSRHEWGKRIEIGRDRDYVPTIGGTGTIVIDLALEKKISPAPKIFELLVAVGSDEKGGVKIVETDNTKVSIPLMNRGDRGTGVLSSQQFIGSQ